MIKVRELKDYESIIAFHGRNALILGLKMLPNYQDYSYEDFLEYFEACPPEKRETMYREANHFVNIQKDELKAMIGFASDPNGVPYGPENIKNLSAKDLIDIIVAVSMEFDKVGIPLLSESEKKKSQISQLTSDVRS